MGYLYVMRQRETKNWNQGREVKRTPEYEDKEKRKRTNELLLELIFKDQAKAINVEEWNPQAQPL